MQAILTRYLGPTNTRGARIKASCAAGSITISYPYDLSGQAVHRKAAEALVFKLDWTHPNYGTLLGGQLDSGDYAFVFNSKLSEE
jgi:hypothetical protein